MDHIHGIAQLIQDLDKGAGKPDIGVVEVPWIIFRDKEGVDDV